MNDSKKLLTAMLGDRGYEVLEKAIYKQRTQAVIDPLEYYLPLIVVPRTIISWLVQTIKPMKTGEIKDVKFPGRDDIAIHFEKQDIDQYRAEFVQAGRVIHAFEKQSLPAASGHLMTVGELYDDFSKEKSHDDIVAQEIKEGPKLDEPKAEVPRPEFGALQHMITMANVTTPHDPESVKWEMSHANVRELTGVIGKLIDSLAAKKMSSDRLEDELDKVSEKETNGDPQKRENAQTPEEKNKKDIAATAANPAIEQKQEGIIEIRDDKTKPTQTLAEAGPTPKVVKDGEEAAEGKIAKESLHEASQQAARNIASPRMAEAQNDQDKQRNVAARTKPMTPGKGYFHKKAELLLKPYTSDAQRRWAHTDAGTKALGGKEAVRHWDKESKGKDLPERVGKEERKSNDPTANTSVKIDKAEMPKGAGQPRGPQPPKAPKPPVPASNQPQASASKQAQASGTGGYKPPQTPGAVKPKNPTMAKSDYFRGKLSKCVGKSIRAIATEEQLYKSACPDCGKPEFVKAADGAPEFSPCACFRVLKKDEDGHNMKFVSAVRKSDGNYGLEFDKNADPEVVKMFLLTLKARLLIKKNHGI